MANPLPNQSITSDWVEMHFRLSDGSLFASNEQVLMHQFKERQRSNPSDQRDGVTLPKSFFQGKDKVHINKTVFKRHGVGNRFYQDIYHIWHRNKRYGTMLANSRDAKLIPLDDIQIQVINNKLYEIGWLDDLKQITTDIESKFHNFCRLDIAVDGGQFLQLQKLWMSGKAEKMGRAQVNDYYTNKRACTGFYIGKTKSKKYCKIYNKTRELTKSNKSYIEHFWKLHNIDTSIDVERLELTLKNEESKKFPDINWESLDQPSHLASIMKSNMDKFCDFRWNNGQKNVSRMERIELVNWDQFQPVALPKDSTRPTTDIYSAKITLKVLFQSYLQTNMQSWFDHAFEVAINAGLVQWFNKMQTVWTEDFQHKLGNNSDGVISDSWITHMKSYDVNEQITIFERDKVEGYSRIPRDPDYGEW